MSFAMTRRRLPSPKTSPKRFRAGRRRARPRAALAGGRARTLSRRAACGRSTCPKTFGGPELSYVTLSRGDRNHLGGRPVDRTDPAEPSWVSLRRSARCPTQTQQKLLFGEVLKGTRFGNAFSEFGSQARRRLRDPLRRCRRPRHRQWPEVLLERSPARAPRADRRPR